MRKEDSKCPKVRIQTQIRQKLTTYAVKSEKSIWKAYTTEARQPDEGTD